MFLGRILSRLVGHRGSRVDRVFALAVFVLSLLVLALDAFNDLFANLSALLGLEARLTHG